MKRVSSVGVRASFFLFFFFTRCDKKGKARIFILLEFVNTQFVGFVPEMFLLIFI